MVRGAVDAWTDAGGLDLAASGSRVPGPKGSWSPSATVPLDLALAWGAAEGWRVTREIRGPGAAGATAFLDESARNESVRWGAGELGNVTCHAPCGVLAFAAGGRVGVRGEANGTIAWSLLDAHHWAGTGGEASFAFAFPAGDLQVRSPDARPGDALTLLRASPLLEGRVGLFLHNVTADLLVDGARERLDLRTREEGAALAAGVRPEVVKRTPFMVLFLDAPQASGGTLRLSAPALTVALAGRVEAREATGHLDVEGERHDVGGRSLALEGDFTMRLTTEGGGDARVLRLTLPLAPRSLHARIAGEAVEVVVGGSTLHRDAVLAAAVAGAGALALLLALLSSRIAPGAMLANPNRRRVLDAVARGGGLGLVDVARASGLPRSVARHHLRMLERHRVVESRREGRVVRYYAAGARPEQDAFAMGVALEDPTRRRIALILASSPAPLTQSEVARRAGVSTRLVSYHVARLGESGLVASRGGFPKRYAATERLAPPRAP